VLALVASTTFCGCAASGASMVCFMSWFLARFSYKFSDFLLPFSHLSMSPTRSPVPRNKLSTCFGRPVQVEISDLPSRLLTYILELTILSACRGNLILVPPLQLLTDTRCAMCPAFRQIMLTRTSVSSHLHIS
jgi:hypothetical protein